MNAQKTIMKTVVSLHIKLPEKLQKHCSSERCNH